MAEQDDVDAQEDSGKHKAPVERYEKVEVSPLPPIAPDGGFVPGPMGNPPAVPAATPQAFVCLRGPCRYYWRFESFMASGNPSGTWGEGGLIDVQTGKPLRIPRQINHTCLAHPGTETELTDDLVYVCNRWDPLTPRELRAQLKRQEKHYRRHPDHRPKED